MTKGLADDESFFFAPSIIGLNTQSKLTPASQVSLPSSRAKVHLLSLSIGEYGGSGSYSKLTAEYEGDNEGLGLIRKVELIESCEILSISSSNCVAIDHPYVLYHSYSSRF